MALTFEGVGVENFHRFKNYLLESESIYPEPLRTEEEDFIEILSTPSAVGIVAFEGDSYVGNVLGCPLEEAEHADYDVSPESRGKKIFYLFNIIISPEHQGKGYGHQLLAEFRKWVRSKGFDMIVGHYRRNGSLALIKKAGAQEKSVHDNYDDSGESVVFCELDLTREKVDQFST